MGLNGILVRLFSQPLNLLRQFEQQYGLQKNIQSLKIALIDVEDTHQQLGIRVVPTILIYDSKGQLVKKYLGETKIEATLKYLKPPLNSTLLNHFKTITYVRNYTTKPCIATR